MSSSGPCQTLKYMILAMKATKEGGDMETESYLNVFMTWHVLSNLFFKVFVYQQIIHRRGPMRYIGILADLFVANCDLLL